jgi:hypothetical protein
MSLDFPEPPKESLSSLTEGLGRLPAYSKYAFTTEAAGGKPPTISLPHQVFVLNPEQIRTGAGLEAATPTSWRYVLNQDVSGLLEGSAVATAEVMDQDGAHTFSNVQYGWMANAVRRAVGIAQGLAAVQKGAFELRMLRIPAIRIDSIWLKNKVAVGDILVPIRSAIPTLPAFQSYSGDEFMAKLRDFLDKQELFDNSPRLLYR